MVSIGQMLVFAMLAPSAGLELAAWTRLASNSQSSACLCLWSTGRLVACARSCVAGTRSSWSLHPRRRAESSAPADALLFSVLSPSRSVPGQHMQWWCHTQLITSLTGRPTGQPSLDNPSLRLSSPEVLHCVKLPIKTNISGTFCAGDQSQRG